MIANHNENYIEVAFVKVKKISGSKKKFRELLSYKNIKLKFVLYSKISVTKLIL